MNRLILRSLITASLLLVLLSVPSIASADSILFNLTASFAGGGTASGSFLFDGTTYTDISITTSTTTSFPGVWAGALTSPTGVAFGSTDSGNLSGPVLVLMFAGMSGLGTSPSAGTFPLLGGTFSGGILSGSGEFTCNDTGCTTFTTPLLITGGDVVGTAVVTPEPSALSLLVMGLVTLLAGVAIRKGAHA